MSNEENTLRYGDVVRIHGIHAKNKDMEGILISKGFTDPFVYYLKCNSLEEVQHYRESLFQVLPSSTFHVHDELLKEDITYNLYYSDQNKGKKYSKELKQRSQPLIMPSKFKLKVEFKLFIMPQSFSNIWKLDGI